MEATYDPEADAAYLRVRAPSGPTHQDVAEDGTVVDVDDEEGDVVGYELLSVILRSLDAFQTVPEVGRLLVSQAIDASRIARSPATATDLDQQ